MWCLLPADGFYEWQPVAGKRQHHTRLAEHHHKKHRRNAGHRAGRQVDIDVVDHDVQEGVIEEQRQPAAGQTEQGERPADGAAHDPSEGLSQEAPSDGVGLPDVPRVVADDVAGDAADNPDQRIADDVAGRWSATFASDSEPSVGVLKTA